jgi:hypothetical protein
VRMFLLLAVLLLIGGGMIMTRRAKARRQHAAETKTARLRALRKPSVPFVSASLRGTATPEPPKGQTLRETKNA